MSRRHEHLNFPAETLERRSGFYREARVVLHALFVPDSRYKLAAVLPVPASIPEFSGF
jgi:hypothetical protein